MSFIELYSDKIFDLVNLGKTVRQFNESNGDYIMVEIFKGKSNNVIGRMFSNRLVFRDPDTKNYYTGPYHYHQEEPELGFCSGREHFDGSMTNLSPMVPDGSSDVVNISDNFKKQIDIFKDDSDNIYIKPNEILKLIDLPANSYRLRIHFRRKIKSNLGAFLNIMRNNLIENGCFFSALEATQAGDIDKSIGKNNFVKLNNPGYSPWVLNQTGIIGNEYVMKVTGIEPTSNYVFSCWVAWDENYTGDGQIISFTDVSSQGPTEGFTPHSTTNLGGSYINDEEDVNTGRILKTKEVGGLTWYKVYSFVQTNGNADMGTILMHLGLNSGDDFQPSSNPLGNRFFTDLRFEKVESLEGQIIVDYLNKLRLEEYMSEYQYSVASYNSLMKANSNVGSQEGRVESSTQGGDGIDNGAVNTFENFDVDNIVDGVFDSFVENENDIVEEDAGEQTMRRGGRTKPKPKRIR